MCKVYISLLNMVRHYRYDILRDQVCIGLCIERQQSRRCMCKNTYLCHTRKHKGAQEKSSAFPTYALCTHKHHHQASKMLRLLKKGLAQSKRLRSMKRSTYLYCIRIVLFLFTAIMRYCISLMTFWMTMT